jgi:hypothetical protein
MNLNRIACVVVLAGAFLTCTSLASPAAAQGTNGETAASAQMIITSTGKGSQTPPLLHQKDVTVLLKNRPAEIQNWESLQGPDAGLQLVFLFDESARSYLALQFPSLRKFIMALQPSAEVAVAYMANGRAVMAQTLTPDHALAAKSLRLTNQIPGISGSPYFCLSDLAKKWPSQTKTRRVVLMVTNGEDPYYGGGSLQDPYVDSAISDSQKAGLLVYSIYFRDQGHSGRLGTLYGQNFLLQVSAATGGQSYANLMTSPVSFDPYLEQFKISLKNQYRLTIAAQGSGVQRVKVKSNVPGLKLTAPSAVYVSSGR